MILHVFRKLPGLRKFNTLKYRKEHPVREQDTSPSFLFYIDDINMPKTSVCDWR
jgi:hypothetical protein